jgi:hypothetical protein
MGQIFKIREIERDDELGIVEKEVSSNNGTFSFESPIVSQRTNRFDPDSQKVKINEVIRHIDDEVVNSIATRGTKPFSDAVKYEYLPDRFNATIFDLKYNSVPNDETIKIIAHALHSSSQNAIILPAVRTAFLQDRRIGRKTPVFSERKIQDYVHMMRLIMNETEAFVNGKEVIGTVPFIPFRFVRPIINLYLSWNIRVFAIDANHKDIIGNIGDFTLILSKINERIPLNKALIFACNAGIPHFEQNEAVSDDFLSVFAYVDVLGCTFKARGGSGEPRAKVFSRDKYAYDLFKYPEVSRQFGKAMNYVSLRNYNRSEQRKETLKVRNLLGVESMKKYLQTKSAVDQTLVKRLESVARNVKIA